MSTKLIKSDLNKVQLNIVEINKVALNSFVEDEGHAHGEYFDLLDKNGFYLQDVDGYELLAQ